MGEFLENLKPEAHNNKEPIVCMLIAYVANLSAKGVKNPQNPVNVVYGCPQMHYRLRFTTL